MFNDFWWLYYHSWCYYSVKNVLPRLWTPAQNYVRIGTFFKLEWTCHLIKLLSIWFSLEEEGIITDCSLKTMGDCDILDFEIVNSEVVCRVILRAPDFKDVLVDLDSSSDFVEFFLSPEDPYFRITTEGLAGKFEVKKSLYSVVRKKKLNVTSFRLFLQVDIPKDSKIVESFDCSKSITAKLVVIIENHKFWVLFSVSLLIIFT